jgi:hypothetical protein
MIVMIIVVVVMVMMMMPNFEVISDIFNAAIMCTRLERYI